MWEVLPSMNTINLSFASILGLLVFRNLIHSIIRAPFHTVCMPEIMVQLYRDICNSVLIQFVNLTSKHMMIEIRVSNVLITRFDTLRKNSCLSTARAPKLCLIINFTIFCRQKKSIACGLLLRDLIALTHKFMPMNKSNADNFTIFRRQTKSIACGLLLRDLVAFTHKSTLMNKSNSDGHLSVSRLCFGWNF